MKLPQPSSIAKSASQNHWTWLQRTQPFSWIQNLFNITDSEAMLNAQTLNYLKNQMKLDMPLSFVCQSRMHDEAQYYEQIIFSQGIVPTRPNSWHDFYNGVIWLQFPKTKRLLNRWHVEDIEQFGMSPRNKRRNQITHFDECGVILVCEDEQLLSQLRQHQFKHVLYEQRHRWGSDIHGVIFGHANYEMLMKPYIGLTGKWLAIEPCVNYFSLPVAEQLNYIDETLVTKLTQQQEFSGDCHLSPLPLLGVPGWYAQNIEAAFYDNQDYFRPKSTKLLQPTTDKS